MELMKCFLAFLATPLLTLAMLGIMMLISERKILVCDDIIRIPTRYIRKITMSEEERAKIKLKEYMKLKNFLDSLDIPIDEKRSFLWSIEHQEKKCIEKISENIKEETLKKLKQEI